MPVDFMKYPDPEYRSIFASSVIVRALDSSSLLTITATWSMVTPHILLTMSLPLISGPTSLTGAKSSGSAEPLICRANIAPMSTRSLAIMALKYPSEASAMIMYSDSARVVLKDAGSSSSTMPSKTLAGTPVQFLIDESV